MELRACWVSSKWARARKGGFKVGRGQRVGGVKPFAEGRLTIRNLDTGKKYDSRREVHAFVDSGASTSLLPAISMAVLDPAIGPLRTKPTKVVTGNGVKDVLMVEGVEVCMNHCCYRGNVIVTDDTPGAMMLGMDFLVQSNARIDFKRGSMVCGAGQRPLPLKMVD